MVMLLSFLGEWVLAGVVFSVVVGLVGWGVTKSDIEENPSKYRDWLDADEAKKKH